MKKKDLVSLYVFTVKHLSIEERIRVSKYCPEELQVSGLFHHSSDEISSSILKIVEYSKLK